MEKAVQILHFAVDFVRLVDHLDARQFDPKKRMSAPTGEVSTRSSSACLCALSRKVPGNFFNKVVRSACERCERGRFLKFAPCNWIAPVLRAINPLLDPNWAFATRQYREHLCGGLFGFHFSEHGFDLSIRRDDECRTFDAKNMFSTYMLFPTISLRPYSTSTLTCAKPLASPWHAPAPTPALQPSFILEAISRCLSNCAKPR